MNENAGVLHVDMPQDKLIAAIAGGDDTALTVLNSLIECTKGAVAPLLIDLASMHISGKLLVAAAQACTSIEELRERLALRDEALVAAINLTLNEGEERAVATRPTRSPVVDAAVQAALQEAGKVSVNEALRDMGEGAAYVHDFFVSLIVQMQRLGRFTTNFHVNLPTEGAERAVFAITLTELLTKDGKPYGAAEDAS